MTDKTQDVARMSDGFFNLFAEEVTGADLGGFLASKFFGSLVKAKEFEETIYDKSASGQISIGECMWRFATVKGTNTFFMYPNIDTDTVIHNQFDSYKVDNRVLGLIATLTVFRSMRGHYVIQNKELALHYAALQADLAEAFFLLVNGNSYNVETTLTHDEVEAIRQASVTIHDYLYK